MSTYSPVDELTLSMKWAVNEMAVDESPPHRNWGSKIFYNIDTWMVQPRHDGHGEFDVLIVRVDQAGQHSNLGKRLKHLIFNVTGAVVR
jgi:hypothetical protein